MKKIIIIWSVIGICFLCLGFFHVYQSMQNITYFTLPERPLENKGSIKALGLDIDTPIDSFKKDLNEYIEKQNRQNKIQNWLAAGSFFASALLCLLSVLLESWWFRRKYLA